MGPQAQIDVMDLYATSRACGGHHTLTYPNRRITRMGTIKSVILSILKHCYSKIAVCRIK